MKNRLGRTTIERLKDLSVPEPMSGCWIWIGARMRNGYGHIGLNRGHAAAHRVAYEVLRGPIPDGLVLDHLCRTRACINPAHVEPVTQRVNLQRGNSHRAAAEGRQRRRLATTHCRKGHPLSGDNLYIYPGRNGRECRRCHADREQRRRERLEAAR